MHKGEDYARSRDALLALVQPVETQQVDITRCGGRILAMQVVACADVPPFDRSPYDGYAFRAADTVHATAENPVTLRILEEIPAGSMWTQPVTPGTASKILTGAPVPEGADAVCMFEKTVFTPDTVTISQPCRSGENVICRGEDVKRGQLLAQPGQLIDGPLAGTLAAQGVTGVTVYRRVKVGVITTGSELTEAGETPAPGKIVNTNRYTYLSELERRGFAAEFYGVPGDTVEEISAALERALEECDLVLTTGGVSVGDYDLTPAAMEAVGGEIVVKNVALKPGGKCCYALRGGKVICALSGNPASGLTNFYAITLPLLRRLAGYAQPLLPRVRVALAERFPKKSPKHRLLRGWLCLEDGRAGMRFSAAQGNGVLHTMVGCNLLADIPAGSPALEAGTELEGFLLE